MHIFDDFEPDGFVVVRAEDIVSVRLGVKERFWHRMLASERLLPGLKKVPHIDLSSIEAALNSITRVHRHVILRCEDNREDVQDFYIGECRGMRGETIAFRHFDVQGRWYRRLAKVPVDEITLIEFDTPYIRHFTRYMTRIRRVTPTTRSRGVQSSSRV